MKQKTTEEKVSQAILQQTSTIKVGDEEYEVAPPTIATLILVSELISQLPAIELDSDSILTEVLYVAKDCRILGDIVAVLMLGAKNTKENRTVKKKRLFGLITEVKEEVVDTRAELSEKLINTLSPRELNSVLIKLLQKMHVADFFGTTTSLIEINLLRKTREVVTTASGLQ